MQLFETAENIKASHCEESSGYRVGEQRSTIRNNLRRIIYLILRHRFTFAQFFQNRFVRPYFFA